MGALSITGIKPGSTSLKLTAGKITKTVPITVLSRNLLSYGPAEGNGLTATVNTDGSLHVTGAATGQWCGLSWTFPCPVQGTVILRSPHLYRRVDRQRQIPRRQRTPARRSGHLGRQCRCNPCRHRQPALRNPLQRGHAHREGRRPPNPVGIRHYRARLDATRQHKP